MNLTVNGDFDSVNKLTIVTKALVLMKKYQRWYEQKKFFHVIRYGHYDYFATVVCIAQRIFSQDNCVETKQQMHYNQIL